MNKVQVDQLANEILKTLTDFHDMTNKELKSIAEETSEEVKNEISNTSPVGATKKYSRSWRIKKLRENANSILFVVHSIRYQLTRLLEFGHAKRNGGRTRAIPHIAPAEQKGIESFEKKLKARIENG
ncbi:MULTISPECIES: HK97 gp10 family phage protein [unclassified Gemella]|uniref:HK97 gp10 family phage protein n=1 Tax=unclassified Gemella TaxID=2624949 RepID=UPI0010743607|nr:MULTISPECIES: HK97 gp10 family phage protein [unclassified Gemella]MBF0710466.1 HK97 gp10 family phage protein [Gemella sp. GL1.1]MBF0746592.1 HK97 gp10 family phage protein [Gemella sp. 19428wG2_WT2a]NYS27810.1 HK97 gp10 family phage protein [Gemella sp. GL1]TFU59947.1 HK97 gp10 family phage protein [Gemella sp. WT2a]